MFCIPLIMIADNVIEQLLSVGHRAKHFVYPSYLINNHAR